MWAESASVQADVLVGERVEGEYYPVVLRRSAAPPIHVAWTGEGVEIR